MILIGFSPCNLERQRIKFCVRHFGQFLSDVNIDVNENLPFLKFPLNLNCCILEERYPIFIKVIHFRHALFTFPIITEHHYFLYNVIHYCKHQNALKSRENNFVELLLASDCIRLL